MMAIMAKTASKNPVTAHITQLSLPTARLRALLLTSLSSHRRLAPAGQMAAFFVFSSGSLAFSKPTGFGLLDRGCEDLEAVRELAASCECRADSATSA